MAHGTVAVGILFEENMCVLDCDRLLTLAEVKKQWQLKIDRSPSVAFFTQDDQYLSDDITIDEALGSSKARMLQLHTFPKSTYWIQVFGLEYTRTPFEVAAILSPAAVRREIGKAVEIYTDDFRLTYGDAVLDPQVPFNEQGLLEGAEVIVDLRVVLKILFDQPDGVETKTLDCFSSDCVGEVRQKLELDDETVLVATSPYRRVLDDALHVCHIVSELLDLEIPIELIAERKVLLNVEPITLEHLRQRVPIALSCTPLDLYDMLSERFQLSTEFRLAVHGQELDNCEPLLNQLLDIDDVIQIDIVRPFMVWDLWPDLRKKNIVDDVYLYSTESAHALYLRDALNDQRLYFEDTKLTIFGSVVDVFGAISGRERPILLVDRDVERNIPTFSFDTVVRKLGWAKDMMFDVISTSVGHPLKEIMWNEDLVAAKCTLGHLHLTENTLMITDPEKVFVSSEKKLRIFRFAHNSTYGDVRSRMQQMKGCLDVGVKTYDRSIPNEEMDRKMDMELYLLISASRFQTKITVTMKDQWYSCWFLPQHVSFSDVMIDIGKQAKVPPRHLFSRPLFCRGCGRKVTMEEEPYQTIPANCCRVRSLQLTDRRMKDVGIQTKVPRSREVETYTLDPESRDACVGTDFASRRAVINATSRYENACVDTDFMSASAVIKSATSRHEDEVDISQPESEPQQDSKPQREPELQQEPKPQREPKPQPEPKPLLPPLAARGDSETTWRPLDDAFKFLAAWELRKQAENPDDVKRNEWKPQEFDYPYCSPESSVTFRDYFGHLHSALWMHAPKTITCDDRRIDQDSVKKSIVEKISEMCSNMFGSDHCRVELDFVKIFFTQTNCELEEGISTLKDLEDQRKRYNRKVRPFSIRTFLPEGLDALITVLKNLGAQEDYRVDPENNIRCICFKKREYEYKDRTFNSILVLNPDDLSFNGWNSHRFYDRTLCLVNPVSTDTAANLNDDCAFDVRIKTVSATSPGSDQLRNEWSEAGLTPPPVLTKPGLDGLIRRDRAGYYNFPRDSRIVFVQEKKKWCLKFKMDGISVELKVSDGRDFKVLLGEGRSFPEYTFECWPKVLFYVESEQQIGQISELVARCAVSFMEALAKRELKPQPWRCFMYHRGRVIPSTTIQLLRRIAKHELLEDMLGVRGECDLSVRLQEVLEEVKPLRYAMLTRSPGIPEELDPAKLVEKLQTAAEERGV